MQVYFRRARLRRCAENLTAAIREWGPVVGPRYVARVAELRDSAQVPDLYRSRSLGFHSLAGDRAGQHALRITGQVRLVLTVLTPESVVVEEVVDYHG